MTMWIGLHNWLMVHNNNNYIFFLKIESDIIKMYFIETPLSNATETAVALVEWAMKSVDTPAILNAVSLSHRATVAGVTG